MRLFLLWCRVCTPEPTPDNAMPFGSLEERGRWAGAHRRGTGHNLWLCYDEPDRFTINMPERTAITP